MSKVPGTHFAHRSRSRSAAWQRAPGGPAAVFVQATDFGLICALFAVPFCMGGRQPLGQLVLSVSACWAAFAWSIHLSLSPQKSWIWTRAEPLLLAAIGLVLLETVRLPVEMVNLLSPRIAELLPLWNSGSESGVSLGPWTQLSLTPAASRLGLVTFVAYALIFVVTAQRLRRVEDVERLLRWICLAVASMAVFGLVQYVTSNGKFFWIYADPFTTTSQDPKGSFTNRNHFAHFLALGIGPLIWWTLRIVDGRRREGQRRFGAMGPGSGRHELAIGLISAALGLVVFVGLLSLSRGGAVAMFVAAFLCIGVLYCKRLVSGRLLAGLTGTGLLACAFLFIYGYESVSERLEQWDLSERWSIWEANLRVVSDFPLFGTGVGSHVEAYQSYLDMPSDDKEFTHAENCYLQVASETGLAGLTLTAIGIGMCFFWCIRGVRLTSDKGVTAAFAAVMAGLAANVVHAMGDFLWYVPGCMVVVTMLAASACRLFQIVRGSGTIPAMPASRPTTPRLVRFALLGGWTVPSGLTCLAVWMIQTQLPAVMAEPHWEQYLNLAFAEEESGPEAEEDFNHELLRRKMSALTAAAKANPKNARIQLRTAKGYLTFFKMRQQESKNHMPLMQIRDAAWASKFESTEALQKWLDRAIGENRKYLDAAFKHTRRALRLCPLQGRGYLYLAELDFLDGAGPDTPQEYVRQAQIVRPYSPQVLFAAGREAWLTGKFELAVANWNAAFHRDGTYQRRIIDLLAPHVSAPAFIKTFEPDPTALRLLALRYKALMNRDDDYKFALSAHAEKLTARAQTLKNREAVRSWLDAQQAFDELGDPDRALRCLQAALDVDPNSFNVHSVLGMWLYRQQRFAEAAEHLTWCSKQRPGDRGLRKLAKKAVEQSLRVGNVSTTPRT